MLGFVVGSVMTTQNRVEVNEVKTRVEDVGRHNMEQVAKECEGRKTG